MESWDRRARRYARAQSKGSVSMNPGTRWTWWKALAVVVIVIAVVLWFHL